MRLYFNTLQDQTWMKEVNSRETVCEFYVCGILLKCVLVMDQRDSDSVEINAFALPAANPGFQEKSTPVAKNNQLLSTTSWPKPPPTQKSMHWLRFCFINIRCQQCFK